MPYATSANLETSYGEAELIQLTDQAGAGLVDEAVLNLALAKTDAEIDGYLVGRYALPLATVPANLVLFACDMARYRLYKDAAPEEVRNRYRDAVRYLEKVAAGQIGLGPDATGASQAPAGGAPSYSAPVRVFSDDTLSMM